MFDLQRVRAALSGDAYNWLLERFPRRTADGLSWVIGANDDPVSLGGGTGGVTNEVVNASRLIAITDDGKNLQPSTTGLVFTLGAALSPAPTVFFTPPSAGSFTITATGGVKINGVVNNVITRSSSNGIVSLTPTAVADEYLLSGV